MTDTLSMANGPRNTPKYPHGLAKNEIRDCIKGGNEEHCTNSLKHLQQKGVEVNAKCASIERQIKDLQKDLDKGLLELEEIEFKKKLYHRRLGVIYGVQPPEVMDEEVNPNVERLNKNKAAD